MLTRLTIAASALALMAACSNETPAPAATAEAPTASEAAAAAPAEPTQTAALPASDTPAAEPAAVAAPTAAPVTPAAATPVAMPVRDTASHAMAPPAATPAPPATAPAAAGPATVPYKSPNTVTNYSLPIGKIANFKLKDQNGVTHELYKMTDAKVIVLTMHTTGCPIGQQLMPDFNALHEKYEPLGVKFLMLNSNTYDTPEMIAKEAKNFHVSIPILKDADQSVGEPLGVERSTESLIIQPGTWKILYQGPINDRVTYGRARAKADVHYASAVIDAMLAGKAVQPSYIAPEGCILTFDNRS